MFNKLRSLKKPDPEAEQKLRSEIEEAGGLEKNDMKAMILSAMLVFLPVAAVIFLLFVAFAWLLL